MKSMTTYDVRISRYDFPNFSVSVQPDRQYYLPGQNAEVSPRRLFIRSAREAWSRAGGPRD